MPSPIGPRDEQRHDERGRRRGRGHREDLHVVAHVEHDPAGQKDCGQRQQDREQREPGELEPDGRQLAQQERDDEPDGQRAQRDEDGELDHGENR